jgi:hypothetical protein
MESFDVDEKTLQIVTFQVRITQLWLQQLQPQVYIPTRTPIRES